MIRALAEPEKQNRRTSLTNTQLRMETGFPGDLKAISKPIGAAVYMFYIIVVHRIYLSAHVCTSDCEETNPVVL